jgi:hypothetical protein
MACTRGPGLRYPPDRNVENPGGLKALPGKSAARALAWGTKRDLAPSERENQILGKSLGAERPAFSRGVTMSSLACSALSIAAVTFVDGRD